MRRPANAACGVVRRVKTSGEAFCARAAWGGEHRCKNPRLRSLTRLAARTCGGRGNGDGRLGLALVASKGLATGKRPINGRLGLAKVADLGLAPIGHLGVRNGRGVATAPGAGRPKRPRVARGGKNGRKGPSPNRPLSGRWRRAGRPPRHPPAAEQAFRRGAGVS